MGPPVAHPLGLNQQQSFMVKKEEKGKEGRGGEERYGSPHVALSTLTACVVAGLITMEQRSTVKYTPLCVPGAWASWVYRGACRGQRVSLAWCLWGRRAGMVPLLSQCLSFCSSWHGSTSQVGSHWPVRCWPVTTCHLTLTRDRLGVDPLVPSLERSHYGLN
jgi:hypothetical protein